jgi:hypothetical protein
MKIHIEIDIEGVDLNYELATEISRRRYTSLEMLQALIYNNKKPLRVDAIGISREPETAPINYLPKQDKEFILKLKG